MYLRSWFFVMERLKKKSNIGFIVCSVVVVILLGVLLGRFLLGNNIRVSKILNYMEEKYHTQFEYVGETGGILWDDTVFTAKLTHKDYPGEIILAYHSKKDGKNSFGDNFPAIYFHDEAYQVIEDCLDKAFQNYTLYFQVPDLVLPSFDAASFQLEDYLAIGSYYNVIGIFVYEPLNDAKFQIMMNAFKDAGVSFKGSIVEPSDYEVAKSISSYQDFNSFIINKQNVTTWFNFRIEDGVITKDVLRGYGLQ